MQMEKYPLTDRSVEALKKYILGKLGKTETRKLPVGYEEEKDPSDVAHLSKDKFYTAYKADKYLFVQYWTAWCSQCLLMDTAWEALASVFNDPPEDSQITIATVDCVLDKEICDDMKVTY